MRQQTEKREVAGVSGDIASLGETPTFGKICLTKEIFCSKIE